MDTETVIVIAAIPFYALSLVIVSYAASYAFHKAKELNDSAAEQQITESLPYTK